MTVTLPAGFTIGKSFEYGLDVNLATVASPSWQSVRRISSFQPTPTPTTQDAQTYDDLGAINEDVTGWSWSLVFNVQINRSTTTGLYLPEVEAFLARTRPTAKGEAAIVDVRWYHKPESGEPNPNDAFRGIATVATSRQNTGPNGEIEVLQITLTGKGPAEEISNPFTGWDVTVPIVAAVDPEGAAVGELVTITGSGLLGATAVEFDSVASTEFVVVNASTIIATIPAGSAGEVDVEVTTPGGTSAVFAYTRGA